MLVEAMLFQPTLGIDRSASCKLCVVTGPCGSYFDPNDGAKPVALLADAHHVRAAKGGAGGFKLGR